MATAKAAKKVTAKKATAAKKTAKKTASEQTRISAKKKTVSIF